MKDRLRSINERGSDYLATMTMGLWLNISHVLAIVISCWSACWEVLPKWLCKVAGLAYFQFLSDDGLGELHLHDQLKFASKSDKEIYGCQSNIKPKKRRVECKDFNHEGEQYSSTSSTDCSFFVFKTIWIDVFYGFKAGYSFILQADEWILHWMISVCFHLTFCYHIYKKTMHYMCKAFWFNLKQSTTKSHPEIRSGMSVIYQWSCHSSGKQRASWSLKIYRRKSREKVGYLLI